MPKRSADTPTRLDRLIKYVSPGWHLRRRVARAQAEAVELLSAYRGASKDRPRGNYSTSYGSADEDLLGDVQELRQRTREFNRNNPYAAGMTESIVSNVVGSGLRIQSRVDHEALGISPETAKEFQKSAERAWYESSRTIDASGHMDRPQLEQLCMRQLCESGAPLLLRQQITDDPTREYSHCWQAMEADRLETPSNRMNDPMVRDGIRINEHGRAVGYWIRKTHPGDISIGRRLITGGEKDYMYVPARDKDGRPNVIHFYQMLRPGQTHGAPLFAPILSSLDHLDGYQEAEYIAARLDACRAFLIQSNSPLAQAQNDASLTDSSGNRINEMSPGMIAYVNNAKDFSSIVPTRPGSTFAPTTSLMLRGMGAGVGLPYEFVAQDYSQVNYSSVRAAILAAQRLFRARQALLFHGFSHPDYELILEEAFLRGRLVGVDDFYGKRRLWCAAEFAAPEWEWVDPLKEVQAKILAIQAHLSTYAKEAKGDWEDVFLQLDREISMLVDHGLAPDETGGIHKVNTGEVTSSDDEEGRQNDDD